MTHPKSIYQMFVFMNLVLVAAQRGGLAEDYSQLLPFCTEPCPWNDGQSIVTDVNGSVMCHHMQFPETPYEIALPPCKNITAQRNEADKLFALELSLQNIWRPRDNQSVNICYNLSPQLLNCKLKLLNNRLYAYDASRKALKNCKTKEFVGLGDFYALPGQKGVVGCQETIEYHWNFATRCQFIVLAPTDYEWLENNTTLRMLPSNRTINHPYQDPKSTGTSNITVCYPLNAQMTKCKRDKLYPHEYRKESDFRIYNLRSRKHLNFGDYLALGNYQIDVNTSEVQFCKDEQTYTCVTPVIVIYILSEVSLILAMVIHAWVPSINHHAMPLLCQMFSMAVFYLTMLYLLLWHPETRVGSYVLFAFRYCSALATYFWLNVLSFDLWRVFANLLYASQPTSNMSKYLIYCAYAFGIPIALTIFCLILETDTSLQDAIDFHPDITDNYWFKEFKSNVTFYACPVALMLCGNLIWFVLTICNLKQAFMCVQAVNKERYKQLFSVCVKIFFTTGLSWVITESVPFWAGGLIKYIAWLLSSSQGALVFIIYICKPYTYRMIRKKLKETSLLNSNMSSSRSDTEITIIDEVSTQSKSMGYNCEGQFIPEITHL